MFPLIFPLVFLVFFAGSAPFVKDRAIRILPYIILVSRATLIMISEPPRCVSSLVFVDFVPNSKIPHKNSPPPNFFVICWCDEVLLDLVHGFHVLQVDLAFPHLFPNFHPQNLPNFAPDLTSPRGVLPVRPRIPSPDIWSDSSDIRPNPDIWPLTASLHPPLRFPPNPRQILSRCPHTLPHTTTTSA